MFFSWNTDNSIILLVIEKDRFFFLLEILDNVKILIVLFYK